jgi:PmbA protein
MSKKQTIFEQFDKDETARRLQAMAEQVLALARRAGATACEVHAGESQGAQIEVRKGDLETVEFNRDTGISVTCYSGQRKGSSSTTDMTAEGLRLAVESATTIARAVEADPYAGLPEPSLHPAPQELQDLDLFRPVAWTLGDMEARAKAAESAGLAVSPLIQQCEGASVSVSASVRVVANSQGFCGTHARTRYGTGVSFVARDEAGMQRDYDFDQRIDASSLLPADQLGRRAAEKTVRRLGPRKPPQGNYPVIFEASVARGFWGHLLSAMSGSAIYRGSSFLCDRLGETLLPDWLSWQELPRLPGGQASALFDNDGVATREKWLVKDGQLQTYLLSCYAARKLGMQPTGNAGGSFNLRFHAPKVSVPAMLEQAGTGLWVTELMGQGVNLVTGDYSRGASGFWFENGELAYPVAEVTIAGRLQEMYLGVEALGDDVDTRSGLHTGSVCVQGMTIGSR